MKNKIYRVGVLFMVCVCALSGMNVFAYGGEGAVAGGNLSPIYGFVAIFSLALMVGYLLWHKKREKKFMLLYCCVAAANLGYWLLSISATLSGALWANRLSYLGCAFAVLMMLLIVGESCGFKMKKAVVLTFTAITSGAFLLAASGGWLNIYYSSVAITEIQGMTVLVKSYAPLHMLYTVYVLSYFVIMAIMIAQAKKRGGIKSVKYAIFLAVVVFGNIAVWGVEQLIEIEFEFLSISFVTTEVFLLLVWLIMQDYDKLSAEESRREALNSPINGEGSAELPPDIEALFNTFAQRVSTLTASERMLLQYYIEGCTTSDAATKMYISVNTARKHNSNLNKKLQLSSREELGLYIDLFRRAGRLDEIAYIK